MHLRLGKMKSQNVKELSTEIQQSISIAICHSHLTCSILLQNYHPTLGITPIFLTAEIIRISYL